MKNRSMYFYITFGIDGVDVAYTKTMTITDTNPMFVDEALKLIGKEIKRFMKQNRMKSHRKIYDWKKEIIWWIKERFGR